MSASRAGGSPNAAQRALYELARAHGAQVRYQANDGRRLRASDDALLAVLRALGAPLDDVAGASQALAEWEASRDGRTVEPVVAHWTVGVPAPLVAVVAPRNDLDRPDSV